MTVDVLSIVKLGPAPVVSFSTAYGSARGVWKGSGVPEPGKHSVEIDPVAVEGDDTIPRRPSQTEFSIRSDDQRAYLTGTVEASRPGMIDLRLGEGLLMFECRSDSLAPGQWVEIGPVTLEIFPTNI